jgi:Tfp pilus assembly protein PilF
LLTSNGKPDEALPFLKRANALHRDDVSARELAGAYSVLGQIAEARATLEKALAQRETAELHHTLAALYEKEHDPLAAVREYQRAAELSPSEPNLFDWGAELLNHRTLQPAIEVFTRGQQRYPQSARMLVGLGVAWYASGSSEQGAQYVSQAADLDSANSVPFVILGKMAVAEARTSRNVLDHLAKFANQNGDNPLANYYYAVALWKQEKALRSSDSVKQVEALLEKARQADPKLAGASMQLGIVREEQGNLTGASEAYEAAISADPNFREAHYRLAQLYRRTSKKAQAEEELATYNRISREVLDQNEREAHEIPQFVYTLRDSKSPAAQQ